MPLDDATTTRLAGKKRRLGAFDVHAVQLLGVLGLAGHLAGAVEDAVATRRRVANGGRVEHVALSHHDAGREDPTAARECHDLVPVLDERRHEVRAEKAGGPGDEVARHGHRK